MKDRVAVNSGRVLITPESGSPYYATVTRADNPTQEGTPLNKASLLKDATALLFGLGADAVPDDVLVAIKSMIDDANAHADTKAKVEVLSYVGTNTYGSSNPCSLTASFAPEIFWLIAIKNTQGPIVPYMGQTDYVTIIPTSVFPTQYAANNMGFSSSGTASSSRATLSDDGKTITWYNSSSALSQCNATNTTYYVLAIG